MPLDESSTPVRKQRPPISWRKRLLFSLATIVLTLAAFEGISEAWIRLTIRDSWEGLRVVQKGLSRGGSPEEGRVEAIHPYLGWALNPDLDAGPTIYNFGIPVNSLGFNDVEHRNLRRTPEKVVIAVVGGSVAWQMTVLGEAAFRRRLQEHERFRDKEIEIVRLAMPGYKQPQQVMALAYLLSLGAEFDAVVNIDGYNEIALPVCENRVSRVNTVYPRMWHARLQNVVDPRTYSFSFQLLQARASRQEAAAAICQSWWRWSATRNLIWILQNQRYSQQIVEAGESLKDNEHRFGRGFASDGPSQQFADDQELFEQCTALWRDSSLQLAALARGNGAAYVHCLQPNQYVEGSKPMGEWEREKMIAVDQEYGQAVARGYPMLIEAGKSLQERGIAFHDLTQLFATIEEPLYRDPFCHYNERGNEIFAEAVAEKVIEALAGDEKAGP